MRKITAKWPIQANTKVLQKAEPDFGGFGKDMRGESHTHALQRCVQFIENSSY